MKPKSDIDFESQINCLHRVKNEYREKNIRTLKNTDVTAQYKADIVELKEEQKFLNFFNTAGWPVSMGESRRNMLQTTILDKQTTFK